jgi:hypothetical protein
MACIVHPVTGFGYVHILPKNGAFDSIRSCYGILANNYPWLQIREPWEFDEIKRSSMYTNDRVFIVTWVNSYAGPKEMRSAKVAAVYSEAIGPREAMLPDHRKAWDEFSGRAHEYDLLLGHTPFMAAQLAKLGVPSAVFPVGWDHRGLGTPDFSRSRDQVFAYYGSPVGKRTWSVRGLGDRLGKDFRDLTGTYGRPLMGELGRSRAALYLAHSDVESFSTWRTWQALAAGAAMIGEPADTWPLVPGRHYAEIPRLTERNLDAAAIVLREYAGGSTLETFAKCVHSEIAPEFTVEKCIEKYLVPASMGKL